MWYSCERSIPMNDRSLRRLATPVVPLPVKGSSTVPPFGQNI